jgi:hypothetical protein
MYATVLALAACDPRVELLGHPSYRVREAAEWELWHDPSSRPAIRAARSHPDPEVRLRADRLWPRVVWRGVTVSWYGRDRHATKAHYLREFLPMAERIEEAPDNDHRKYGWVAVWRDGAEVFYGAFDPDGTPVRVQQILEGSP